MIMESKPNNRQPPMSKEAQEEERRRSYWQPKQEIREFSLTQTNVCTGLAKHMMSNEAPGGKNMVFSPLSIHVVLGLMSAGLNGEARDQLLGYLKTGSCQEFGSLLSELVDQVFADGTPYDGPHLAFLNQLWLHISYRLKDGFKEIVDQFYNGAVKHVDFKNQAVVVRKEVNVWAEQKTNGLIKDILPPDSVDELTRLIFTNALYFKGTWASTFDASKTRHDDFFLLNGKTTRVPFITSGWDQLISCYDSSFKVLKLRYKISKDHKRGFSMYIYLPNAKDGLPALVQQFGSEPGFIEKHIPNTPVKVGDFRFPKFKISYNFKPCEVLMTMGLVTPFTSELTELAYPTDHNDTLPLKRSTIFHKSFIEVDEQGTKAATVTTLCSHVWFGLKKEVTPPKMDFVADHPFLFIIREDKTGTVLFVGQLLNPLA